MAWLGPYGRAVAEDPADPAGPNAAPTQCGPTQDTACNTAGPGDSVDGDQVTPPSELYHAAARAVTVEVAVAPSVPVTTHCSPTHERPSGHDGEKVAANGATDQVVPPSVLRAVTDSPVGLVAVGSPYPTPTQLAPLSVPTPPSVPPRQVSDTNWDTPGTGRVVHDVPPSAVIATTDPVAPVAPSAPATMTPATTQSAAVVQAGDDVSRIPVGSDDACQLDPPSVVRSTTATVWPPPRLSA